MTLDSTTVAEYVRQAGWEFIQSEQDIWKLVGSGSMRDVPVYLRLRHNWLLMHTPIFNLGPDDKEESLTKLYEHFLRLNSLVAMAKFGVTEEGNVILCVELPTSDLQFSEFDAGLKALCRCVEEFS